MTSQLRRTTPLLPAFTASLLAVASVAAAGEDVVRLPARTLARDGVTMAFPAVTYHPPTSQVPAATVCAAMASEAIGTKVDPVRDLVAETEHRVVLRDPTDAGRLLKVYRPDNYKATEIAKLVQRDLAVEAYLQGLGLRVATIDRTPRLLERGVIRQQRIAGKGLDDLYPQGYRAGTNPAVDRVLARIAPIDGPVKSLVSQQSGLLFTNTVDCHTDRPLGVDLGHCYANIFLETASGQPVFVDW